MEYSNYLEESERTLSNQYHIEDVQNLLHAVMGICTEVEELLENFSINTMLDSANLLEELGDLYWYIAIIHRDYPMFKKLSNSNVATEVKYNSSFKAVLNINKYSLKMLDILKKKIYYNKEIDLNMLNNYLLLIEVDIKYMLDSYNYRFESMLQINIDKLKARYKEKFNSKEAIERDLDTERTILENGERGE